GAGRRRLISHRPADLSDTSVIDSAKGGAVMVDWPVILAVGGALVGTLAFLKIVADELSVGDRVLVLKKQYAEHQKWRAARGDCRDD
ncbi:MAG: hypothetical protein ACE5GE_17560, partial [Phycisphaerae bacterium]